MPLQVTLQDCNRSNNQRLELLVDGSLRIAGTNRCIESRSGGTSKCRQWNCASLVTFGSLA